MGRVKLKGHSVIRSLGIHAGIIVFIITSIYWAEEKKKCVESE